MVRFKIVISAWKIATILKSYLLSILLGLVIDQSLEGPYINTYIIIQLTPHWGFSVTDYIKYYGMLTYVTLA